MDEWSQLGKLKAEPNIGILSKLGCNKSLPILKIVYHSLFGSHLQYGTQLWGQGNWVNNKITCKTFRTEHEGRLLNSKTSFTFKTVFVLQIEQNQALAKSFVTTYRKFLLKEFWTLFSIKQILMVLIQQNIIVFWIGTSLKGSSLTSKKLTIIIQKLNH